MVNEEVTGVPVVKLDVTGVPVVKLEVVGVPVVNEEVTGVPVVNAAFICSLENTATKKTTPRKTKLLIKK